LKPNLAQVHPNLHVLIDCTDRTRVGLTFGGFLNNPMTLLEITTESLHFLVASFYHSFSVFVSFRSSCSIFLFRRKCCQSWRKLMLHELCHDRGLPSPYFLLFFPVGFPVFRPFLLRKESTRVMFDSHKRTIRTITHSGPEIIGFQNLW
jgi:hypothetical protein